MYYIYCKFKLKTKGAKAGTRLQSILSRCPFWWQIFNWTCFLALTLISFFRKQEISHPSVVKKSLKTRRRVVIKIVKKDLTEIESAAATVTVIAGETVTRTVIRTVTEIVTAIGTVTEGGTGIETGSVIVIRIGIVKGIGIVTEIVIVSVIVTGIVTVIVTSTVIGVVTGAVNGIAIVIVIVIETVGVTRIAIEIATGIVKGRRRRKGDATRMRKMTSARKTEMMQRTKRSRQAKTMERKGKERLLTRKWLIKGTARLIRRKKISPDPAAGECSIDSWGG